MRSDSVLLQAVPPPHRAGYPFILIAALLSLAGFLLAPWVGLLGLCLTGFVLFFFRDPERVPPPRPGLILAPADGRVVATALAPPPAELGLGEAPRWRVSIFLSLFNVHVNRVPADGRVVRIAYRAGAFVNAALDKASAANERNAVMIRLDNGQEMAVVQIAGLVARRIVCNLREGEAVRAGMRLGIIRFGSRADLYLPPGMTPLVAEGQTMIGGETVVAGPIGGAGGIP